MNKINKLLKKKSQKNLHLAYFDYTYYGIHIMHEGHDLLT